MEELENILNNEDDLSQDQLKNIFRVRQVLMIFCGGAGYGRI